MPTPRESLPAECARLGEYAVVARCMLLIDGGDADDMSLMAISCGAARQVIEGREGGRTGYWPRVWGPAVSRAAAERALVALTGARQ